MEIDHQHLILKVRDFCIAQYLEAYQEARQSLKTSRGKCKNAEQLAQKAAIQTTFYKASLAFPMADAAAIWSVIYNAHIHRKSGISDDETIRNVLSASQSWKKSSGYAFEEFIQEQASSVLCGENIRIVLQRELSQMLKDGEIHNAEKDKNWFRQQLKGAVFDLYAIVTTGEGKKLVFGCIQSKTSIRDRVTRDREPSLAAMDNFFWSVCITLDGAFLRLPKFQAMVNGGSPEFERNGWHGMYVLSSGEAKGRIYPIDITFDLFREHACQAANFWLTQRQWFNVDWQAE